MSAIASTTGPGSSSARTIARKERAYHARAESSANRRHSEGSTTRATRTPSPSSPLSTTNAVTAPAVATTATASARTKRRFTAARGRSRLLRARDDECVRSGRLVPLDVLRQPPERRRSGDVERLAGLARPGRIPDAGPLTRPRSVRRVVDHGRLVHVLERRLDRGARRRRAGHPNLRRRLVLGVVERRLEQPVVARSELERLVLALRVVRRLEPDRRPKRPARQHRSGGVVSLERLRQEHVRLPARRVRLGHGLDRPHFLVRPRLDPDP